MKITVELPDSLVKEIKRRALDEDLKLKDALAGLLRRGLELPDSAHAEDDTPSYRIDAETGLPVIHCRRAARPNDEMTADRIKEILLAQEVRWSQ
jgi:hypothetical protein